jgi:hypothetical protein
MEVPSEFFTLQSMLTLSGATTATYVISNGLQHAFNYNPKWLALAIALAISLFGVHCISMIDTFTGQPFL